MDLCEFSFDHGFRLKGNPPISSICQVACPPQLVQATGIHRADEQNKNYVCSGKSLKAGQITKTMNCGNDFFFGNYVRISDYLFSLLFSQTVIRMDE